MLYRARAAVGVIARGALSERVQLSGSDIGFHLPVPTFDIEIGEPLAKRGEIFD